MQKVLKFWSSFLNKIEPDVTLELEGIQESKKHGHPICIMRLVGKNVFPKLTAEEILSNPKARAGLSKDDLIVITKLDLEIKHNKNSWRVLEHDRNGIVILENKYGERKIESERVISSDSELLSKLDGRDACKIGYKVGFNDGMNIAHQKQNNTSFLKRISQIIIGKKL